MNILHMKYAVEVARLGSLNKAAEALLVAQPNISRSIKELEADLGITIFHRSARGMELTPEGEEFITYAQNILRRIDEMEMLYKQGVPRKQKFSLNAAPACYIAEAMAEFTRGLDAKPAELHYRESDNRHIIECVLARECRLGILRYAAMYDRHFKAMMDEKSLSYEVIAEFTPVLVVRRDHPLAEMASVRSADLRPYVEIVHEDLYVPSLPPVKVAKDTLPDHAEHRVYVSERAAGLELLAANRKAYLWASPMPHSALERYGLTQLTSPDNQRLYKDVLVRREGYKLTTVDNRFITLLCEAKRRCFPRDV